MTQRTTEDYIIDSIGMAWPTVPIPSLQIYSYSINHQKKQVILKAFLDNEIFGEIKDEHDVEEFVEKQISQSEFIFSGRLELDYIKEQYDLSFPEDSESETLSGFIITRHEAIPAAKEKIVIDKVAGFSSDKLEEVLNNIMSKEFRFVEIIGAVLGFIIGLLQVLITLLQ
jgi:uncharacterized membrane-anchored protein YjiN (DUF445 family)